MRKPRDGRAVRAGEAGEMKNWVLAAILAAAALGMYVAIFVKMGAG